MDYEFFIIDVFSKESFGGNQLAVLPNAKGLSPDGMQKIAREFNFAETTFVFPPEAAGSTARVRIFTPGNEVDFAGHPTVGTACALSYAGIADTSDILLEENVGLVPVKIVEKDGVLYGTLTNTTPLMQPDEIPRFTNLAEVLNLDAEKVLDGFYASVGLDFCFARLASKQAVDDAQIDKAALKKLFGSSFSQNVFFFHGELNDGEAIYARMSAPFMGIEEDPATGSAVAALVGVAAHHAPLENGSFELAVTQGVKMGRVSNMNAKAQVADGKVVSVSVGGAAIMTGKGRIEVAEKWLSS